MPRDYIKVFLNGILKWNHLIFQLIMQSIFKKYCYYYQDYRKINSRNILI